MCKLDKMAHRERDWEMQVGIGEDNDEDDLTKDVASLRAVLSESVPSSSYLGKPHPSANSPIASFKRFTR